ncbi:POTRA domain-containing protein [Azospirillum baldaniorum]|uniref:POTRA domain-containing protein n=1 Tax=Azospirillum baldaniorum TaxID=1064539 RepID=UPI001FE7342F|nr:POTRA domain-containing protein [Azospirillum baldaniorum]
MRSVSVEGATAYSQDSLKTAYQDMLGREVSVADLFKIANDIEFRYRNDGFITSRVIVPAQTIEDGTFRLQVVEGFVSDITYPDDIGPALAAVKRLVEPAWCQADQRRRGRAPPSPGERPCRPDRARQPGAGAGHARRLGGGGEDGPQGGGRPGVVSAPPRRPRRRR